MGTTPERIPSRPDLVDAVHDALAPYAWRALTDVTVVAVAVAAADRARGPQPVGNPPLDVLATRADDRVAALVAVLTADSGWRRLSLREVARRLVVALGAEEERVLWFDLELGWLLDPPA